MAQSFELWYGYYRMRGTDAPVDRTAYPTTHCRKIRRKGQTMPPPKDAGDKRLSLVKKQEKPGAESNLEKDLERARDAARALLKELGVSACFMILMDEKRDEALYSHAVWGENLHHLRIALKHAVQNYEAIELIIDPGNKYRGED